MHVEASLSGAGQAGWVYRTGGCILVWGTGDKLRVGCYGKRSHCLAITGSGAAVALLLPPLHVGPLRPAPRGCDARLLRREGEGAVHSHKMLWGRKNVP